MKDDIKIGDNVKSIRNTGPGQTTINEGIVIEVQDHKSETLIYGISFEPENCPEFWAKEHLPHVAFSYEISEVNGESFSKYIEQKDEDMDWEEMFRVGEELEKDLKAGKI